MASRSPLWWFIRQSEPASESNCYTTIDPRSPLNGVCMVALLHLRTAHHNTNRVSLCAFPTHMIRLRFTASPTPAFSELESPCMRSMLSIAASLR